MISENWLIATSARNRFKTDDCAIYTVAIHFQRASTCGSRIWVVMVFNGLPTPATHCNYFTVSVSSEPVRAVGRVTRECHFLLCLTITNAPNSPGDKGGLGHAVKTLPPVVFARQQWPAALGSGSCTVPLFAARIH